MIPENPLREMAGALDGSSPGNGILAVMVFALIFGVGISLAGERAQILKSFLEGLFDVCMVIIGFAMKLAPVCVALLLFSVTAKLGLDILQSLMWFVIAALTGMLIHLLGVYSIFIAFVARRSPVQFFKDTSEAMLTAFATSSSNATLPTTMKVANEKLKLPQSISRFVLTIGSTGNQNGTALYEGVVVLFIAQLLGHDLTIGQQVQVVLMSVLAGVGTAGVPGGSIPMIAIVLQSVGIDGSSIGIILGMDRLLDMSRTVLNVVGDLVLAACVAQGESSE
jgi:DAACS family dicarboxylate/amino acid:cation (Na+ or H+) symporter